MVWHRDGAAHRDLGAEAGGGGGGPRQQQHPADRLVQPVHRVQLPQLRPQRLPPKCNLSPNGNLFVCMSYLYVPHVFVKSACKSKSLYTRSV